MVRPEPDQPLDKADVGTERSVEARFGFGLKELLRQRRRWFRYRRWRLLLVCGFVRIGRRAWRARGLAAIDKVLGIPGFGLLLRPQRELLLRRLLGAEVKDLARRLAARRQIGGKKAGLRPLQIGEQGAARVGGNGGNRIAPPGRSRTGAAQAPPLPCHARSRQILPGQNVSLMLIR